MKTRKAILLLVVLTATLTAWGITRSDRELFVNSPTRSMWIWHEEDPAGTQKLKEAYFRLKFNVPERVKKATM